LQGYDSVAVKAGVEIGGTDQRFNLLSGRVIQPLYGQKPQDIMTGTLLEGTDGRKMSSSWGNVINITDAPNDMFGKVMSIRDELIEKYFVLATRVPTPRIQEIMSSHANPRDQKLALAREIAALYHGEKTAKNAVEEFTRVFSKRETPSEITEVKITPGTSVLDILLAAGISSKSEARRLLKQNAVELEGERITDPNQEIPTGVLKIGKNRFYRIVIK
jgi:tyrosyl-tRNA synthetase